MFLHFLTCISDAWHSLAIHGMIAINEITTKVDHVPFTCNWFIMFRKCHKFQQILVTAMKSISRKGSFLTVVNVLWKRTLPQLFFYIATLISSKLWKCPVHGNSFSIYCSGEIFLFLWLFLMKGAVVQHSYIM